MNKSYLLKSNSQKDPRPFAYITVGSFKESNDFVNYGFNNGGISNNNFGTIENKSQGFPNLLTLAADEYPGKEEYSSFARPAGYYEREDTGLGANLPSDKNSLYLKFFTSEDVGKTIKIYYGMKEKKEGGGE